MGGSVITADDPGYEQARTVWNAAIDRRPAVIANCASALDVVAAVRFARDQGLEIAVRGGAHSMPGLSVCDDGVGDRPRQRNRVTVDPDAKRARVEGGALLSDLDAATQASSTARSTSGRPDAETHRTNAQCASRSPTSAR